MLNRSEFKNIGIGIVAKDILEDDMYVDVYPMELLLDKDGEISASTTHNVSITDSASNVKSLKLTQSDLIKAKWAPMGDTNRLEPPTVCKGETVLLHQYSDLDQYYWTTPYNQLELRKLEKRTIVVSNKASINIPADELLANSYYVTIDTINKLVHLHTSTTDGEYTEYDLAIDTASGQVELTDAKNNRWHLDSKTDTITEESNSKMVRNTDVTETTSKTSITNNTRDKTENIGNHSQINLKTISVQNSSDELIQTLMDFVQEVIDAQWIGNMNMPAPIESSTQSKLAKIKSRIGTFKG